MTSDEIEISDDVLDAALDAWCETPWQPEWEREALRNACMVAIEADRKSDARSRPPMPEDVAGLCERLRERTENIYAFDIWDSQLDEDCVKAASALEAQAAEIERLRSALDAINKEGE